MSTKPRVFARRAAQVLAASAIAGGGVLVVASPASAATVTSVAVVGSSGKIVSDGSTIAITGTGFTGMTDNADPGAGSPPACVATPAAGCSTVRFIGMNAANTASSATTPTLATRFTVVSDTLIYASVPALPVYGVDGAPSVGYGVIGVSVQNGISVTVPATFNATTTGATGAGQLIYRHKLTAEIAPAGNTVISASALGGGTLSVAATTGSNTAVPFTTASFTNEKVTALFTMIDGPGASVQSARVVSTAVSLAANGNTLSVGVPVGTPLGELVSLELIHDGIGGTPDSDDLKYAAVINRIETCATPSPVWDHTSNVTFPSPVPNCTGPAATGTTANSTFYVEIQGKGFTGAGDTFDFSGSSSTFASDCNIISDALAYCTVTTGATIPSEGAVAVTFTPADPDADATGTSVYSAPAVGKTPGAIFLFTDTV
jgi:hypothetical protein